MSPFEIPDGWAAQAYRFALDPSPSQVRALESHVGAARFAFNHMLDAVKKNLDQRTAERSYGISEAELTPAQGWSLAKLRRTWNRRKDDVAPWWQENSKEAYKADWMRSLAHWLTGVLLEPASEPAHQSGSRGSGPNTARHDQFDSPLAPSASNRTATTWCCRGWDGSAPMSRLASWPADSMTGRPEFCRLPSRTGVGAGTAHSR
jgi:hypothetical protein